MSITASEARKNLFRLIENVNDDRSPVHITSRNGNAVLLSEEDFASWQETIYLLRSPANARRLAESIAEAEGGRTEPRELIEVDDAE
ncbi:type II toxin-antitoxin system Phd/YefM family antitoxin [Streptomyces xinghaiensis]|uniref:type II toxin-antitoxin system Phd/YefM family antitoxin n=1 Tax=Streptomyces xinghaiensis TaxID=1038928 RepID=UPI0005924F72|nr:type II toxin-antitoxin system prevent-host-death family antitoxin [Streptomyces xinghaiensis]MZE77942.1 type II toxin-antitoxin system prevent-host-death family antitoxin [Streptomyces sp. SID5475]